jgi:hypothetical protein
MGMEQPRLTWHETATVGRMVVDQSERDNKEMNKGGIMDYEEEDGRTMYLDEKEEAIKQMARMWLATTHYGLGVQEEISTRHNFKVQEEISSSDHYKRKAMATILALSNQEIFTELKDKHDIAKAVKADGAKVPVELWDKAMC